MTTTPEKRRFLPLISEDRRHGSRSHVTCQYRCGNACDQPIPNQTETPHIRDVVTQALSRRSLLAGAAGAGATGLVMGHLSEAAVAAPGTPTRTTRNLATVDFVPVEPNVADRISVPQGFETNLVIGWGDPVVPGAPRFNAYNQTVASQEKQFGYNCDYVGVLPLQRQDRALLVANHEYTNPELMFPAAGYTAQQKIAIEMAAHGMSVVEIKRGDHPGSWVQVPVERTTYNRRLHTGSEFRLDGPAAGDDRLKTSGDPTGTVVLGTLNNCAGGTTPWGTVLSGEENFNQYFDRPAGTTLDGRYAAAYARYGVSGSGSRSWSTVDPRFDLSKEPHEPHRFGWIVEVDPHEPGSTPVKHTMLGRFKHEGANVAIAPSGHAVAYMGDDERGDYIYKFVSRDTFREGDRAHNKTLLTAGTLYVAKFLGDGTTDGEYDGTGTWIPLTTETQSFVPGMSVNDVLIFTRLAADKMGPTKMDRPEDVEPNPVNGKVYAALTNNSNRTAATADEANPVYRSHVRDSLEGPLRQTSGNRNGYVLELTESGGDHAATAFTWNLLLVAGDPAAQETYFGGYDKSKVSPISCPDNVAFDSEGNLWVSTDGNVLGSNDGIFRVPVEGPERGAVRQFLTVPPGAEACGPLIADGNRSLFVAVQHPGEATGSTFETPTTTWPHTHTFPRPTIAVAYKS